MENNGWQQYKLTQLSKKIGHFTLDKVSKTNILSLIDLSKYVLKHPNKIYVSFSLGYHIYTFQIFHLLFRNIDAMIRRVSEFWIMLSFIFYDLKKIYPISYIFLV